MQLVLNPLKAPTLIPGWARMVSPHRWGRNRTVAVPKRRRNDDQERGCGTSSAEIDIRPETRVARLAHLGKWRS